VPTSFIAVYDPVSYYLGGLAAVLGRYDQADAYFAHADAFNERAGAKYFVARTNLAWAKMLVERDDQGDIERARALLTTAHAVAVAHGYAAIERQAAEALQNLD
jgi:tetratricopeptide (TPR) repeat protein